MDTTVKKVLESYPDSIREPLLAVRALIFETAAQTDGVGELIETLKWGEPAYLTKGIKLSKLNAVLRKNGHRSRRRLRFVSGVGAEAAPESVRKNARVCDCEWDAGVLVKSVVTNPRPQFSAAMRLGASDPINANDHRYNVADSCRVWQGLKLVVTFAPSHSTHGCALGWRQHENSGKAG